MTRVPHHELNIRSHGGHRSTPLFRSHANDADAIEETWVHCAVAARRVVDRTLPENTDTVAEDRLAMREIEGGCADEDVA